MKTLNRIVMSYFIIALPVILVAFMIWPQIAATESAVGSPLLEWGNALSGYLFAFWIATALYTVVCLVFSSRFREQLLKRIAFVKERDEREELIVRRAARNAFLFNIAFLLFLFFLNLVTVDVSKYPPDHLVAGKEHSLSLGLNLSPFVGTKLVAETEGGVIAQTLFRYRFPLTVSGTLLILIIINVGAFSLYARRFGRQ